ncbi:MAG: lipoprotein-releasing ABC transporter permease subunit [Alphaproteobacteria bacterium]|jgi:lipoprotein-releasing system permease protein|nr:lipoprotein-releasing ABC transporter permease subunit [Alphaproteobacteria bacterium]
MPLFTAFERKVAFRYLRARRQEGFISVISWFSLIGIGLGVATLIIVMSVMNGFRAELFDRVLGLNGHLTVVSEDRYPLTQYDEIIARLKKVDGVLEVSPSIEGQALITSQGAASGAMVRGVLPENFQNRDIIVKHIAQGNLSDFDGDKVAIGARLATRLGLHPGDQLTLISPSTKATVFGTAPRMKTYTIAVIFDVGMYEYDSNFVFMPLEAAKIFFRTVGGITSIELFISQPHNFHTIKDRVYDALSGSPTRLMDWQQSNLSFFTALQVEKNVMFLILTLIILVAAFNIISGLIMLVKDKGHDIAILRTMGASRASVMKIFFLAGASIGVLGTGFGLVLGVVFTKNIEHIRQFLQRMTGTDLFSAEIYFLSHLPAILDVQEVIQVVVMALGLSFLATLYPSWRAARLDPVEALRYE